MQQLGGRLFRLRVTICSQMKDSQSRFATVTPDLRRPYLFHFFVSKEEYP
jgi:hypothetical protein